MTDRYKPRVISGAARAVLGEGPVWDERTQLLYWVDIECGEVHRSFADGSNARVESLGQRVGSIALRRCGSGFIAGLEHSIALLTLEPRSIAPVCAPEAHMPFNRCNDGKCDTAGRFWIGTCDDAGNTASGWLYCVDAVGSAARTVGPFICTNGPAFSPDGGLMYVVDSFGKTIHRCRVNTAGELIDQRLWLRFENPEWGYPDGLTCDVEGSVWVAHWGGGRVSHFSPDAELLESIPLLVSQVTSCTFGGPDLCTLFITSASRGLRAGAEPLAGAVFAVDLPIGGSAAQRFDG